MLRFIGRRLLTVAPLVVLLTMVAFALIEMTPGDPALIIAGPDASADAVEHIRRDLGLDQSVIRRYLDYVGSAARGDLGTSYTTGETVTDLIARRLPRTATIAMYALIISVVVSIPLGVIAALRRNRLADRLVTAVAVFLLAVPAFVLAAFLVSFFSLGGLRWFPPTGYVAPGDGLWEWFRHATLPAIAIGTTTVAELTRLARGSLIDAMEEDYVRTARAKGIGERLVVGKHAAKNAAIPFVTILGLNAGRIIGTAVIVEQIFNIRGFGSLGVEAVINRDVPTIQGVVLVSGLIVLTTNFMVDVSYGYFNPRVRRS